MGGRDMDGTTERQRAYREDTLGHDLLEEWGRQLRARQSPLDAWPSMAATERMRMRAMQEYTPDAEADTGGGPRVWEGFVKDGLIVHRWLVGDDRLVPGQPYEIREAVRYFYGRLERDTPEQWAKRLGVTRPRLYELRKVAKLGVSGFYLGFRYAAQIA